MKTPLRLHESPLTCSATAEPESEDVAGWRKTARGWFEYAGVWALAMAWPVYQDIASGAEALTTDGLRRVDLILLIALVSLLAPTILALLEAGIRRLASERAATVFRAFALGALFALLAWQFLSGQDFGQPIRALVPLLTWGVVTYFYVRSEFVQNFAGILGLATPLVIVAFCLRYPISFEVLPHQSPSHAAEVDSETPVVMVIFDELPLASLEDESGRIDSELVPGFGNLASTSTWYPGMRAVADQTVVAVPAILTGETPEQHPGEAPLPPGLPSFPDNLCSNLADDGYSVYAYEPYTDLCQRTYGLGTRVSAAVARGNTSDKTGLEDIFATALTKPFRSPWDSTGFDRDDTIDEFIEGMPTANGSLSVLHVALPHVDWVYMPDGTTYTPDPERGQFVQVMPSERAEADHFLQQMLLQLSFTDRKLSQLVDQMKTEGTWDESLFVVTAHHGASFSPGSSRRYLTDENLGWILPVPLFIKYPGQRTGKVVRGPADSRDITPTVLDALGGKPDDEADGRSLLGKTSLPPKERLEIEAYNGPMEPRWEQIGQRFRQAREHQNATFGDGQLFALGGHRNLVGRKAKQVDGLKPIEAALTDSEVYGDVRPSEGMLPSYVRATLNPVDGKQPGDLAVAANDRIVATAKTWPSDTRWATAVNLPNSAFKPGKNVIEFYSIPAKR